MKALGIGVPAGEPKPCSGILFALQGANGFVWGTRFPNKQAAQQHKTEFMDWRKDDLLRMIPQPDVTLYDVTIVEVNSEEPDAIQTFWGEMNWTGQFDENGKKLYKLG
jgi:hypothetical protein